MLHSVKMTPASTNLRVDERHVLVTFEFQVLVNIEKGGSIDAVETPSTEIHSFRVVI